MSKRFTQFLFSLFALFAVETGLTRVVVSGEDGGYRLEFLPLGNYVIEPPFPTLHSQFFCRRMEK
jgi:hypothetical protein